MPNKILIKRGLKANVPALNAGELALLTDTREVLIGHSGGNFTVGKAERDFCRMLNLGVLTVSSMTSATLTLNTDTMTTNTNMNTTNGIKITKAGFYLLNLTLEIEGAAATGNAVTGIQLNGGTFLDSVFDFTGLASEHKTVNLSHVIKLAVNDVLTIRAANNTNKTLSYKVPILTAIEH